MKSNLFNTVNQLRPRKNVFNLSHGCTYSTDMGLLVPVFIRDCCPNSDFRVSTHNFTRFTALLSPVMDDINLYVHFWKIPYRLLDSNFTAFISGEIEEEDYNPPYFTPKGVSDAVTDLDDISLSDMTGPGSLWDMCGFPNTFVWATDTTKYPLRYFQWYALLLEHWYINLNIDTTGLNDFAAFYAINQQMINKDLEGDQSVLLVSWFNAIKQAYHGGQGGISCTYANHAWNKDYFTSALPNVQRGAPISIPLSGNLPVTIPSQGVNIFGINSGPIAVRGNSDVEMENQGQLETKVPYPGEPGTHLGALMYNIPDSSDTDYVRALSGVISGRNGWALNDVPLKGTADMSEASAVTINELRVLNALQVFKERSMRYGGRYIEYLRGFFNQISSDARLQLPEWLGGGKVPIAVSDIAQTSATISGGTPQGNLAGKGTGFAAGFAGFKHTHIEEESLLVGVCFLKPKEKYAGQGVDKFRTKLNDRYDFYNYSFDHLGEQAIDVRELYAGVPSAVFGYTPRFAEYRCWNSEVHGLFKSSLAYWTTARIFSSAPALNSDFIYIQPDPLKRIFATESGYDNHILVDLWFDVAAKQPMSKYGTPMLLN